MVYDIEKLQKQLKFLQNSQKIVNLIAIFPLERCSVNFWWKSRLHPSEIWCFFQKNDEKNNDFSETLKKFKNIESPKMVSKRLYGHYLRSYEQIKKNRILTTILS